MTEKELLEKNEGLPVDVIGKEFPAIADEIVKVVHQLSKVDAKWPTIVLIVSGTALLLGALLMRIPGGLFRQVNLTTTEFITMLITAASLMIAGPLFNMYLSRNWRKIILEQQALGVQILHEEIDIAREALNRKHRNRWGEIIIFQTKLRKSFRH